MVTVCPICEVPAPALYEKAGHFIHKCPVCGLGQTVLGRSVDFDSLYSESYFSGGMADGYADYAAEENVLRSEFRRTLSLLRKHIGPGRKTLLEVGSAHGYFLEEAKNDFECVGIEFSEDASRHARDRGLNVITSAANAEAFDRAGERFDVIVMLDTIEHLPNPTEVISLCGSRLNPGGILLFTTGDFGAPFARYTGKNWRLMTPPQHLFFFTIESARRMCSASGLKLERADHPWKVVPLSLVLFQLPRIIGLPKLQAYVPAVPPAIGLPVNLFDTMRIMARKPAE